MKKTLILMMIVLLVFGISACGGKSGEPAGFDEFTGAIDTDYSQKIMTELAALGDDPDTGNRSAGSPAEHKAADYLHKVMNDMGLTSVVKDSVAVDGWTFKGANITYKDTSGKDKKIILGGYATNLVAKDEAVQLVYAGEGTAADYEGLEVNGKLVLIDIDQNENWWINYPAYQAKLKGAKAVIAMSIMQTPNKERIGSQDICGPAQAPAYGISKQDSLALQKLMSASENNELTVIFNSDSTINPDGESYNVWGEIPGKSDQVIYLIGHYDGYYHSAFDNASGISTCLGIAKAIIDSGYTPDKTIRVVAHGAEEFGKSGNHYDWATGAYEQIMTNHPKWPETAFAVVNVDGGYPLDKEKVFTLDASHELFNFAVNSVASVVNAFDYEFEYNSPASTGTEDFGWTKAGIPSIVAGGSEDSIYYAGNYHSNMDSIDSVGFNDDAYLMNHQLYGKIILDLDALAVRPMDFEMRFKAFEESIDKNIINDEEFIKLVGQAKSESTALNEKIAGINASKNTSDSIKMNAELFNLYRQIQNEFLRLNCNDEIIFPHEQYQQNIDFINKGIAALKEGDVKTAYDEHLTSVDFAWYATAFDKETCDYFVNQIFQNRKGTWGEGMVQNPVCDIDGVIRSLGAKYDEAATDVTAEIQTLQELLAVQQEYMDAAVDKEKTALKNIVDMIKAI